MTTELAIQNAEAGQAVRWLQHMVQSPLEDQMARDEVEATVAALSEPADTSWLLARVMSLMLPYYEKATPQAVREMEAEDWAEALGHYPQWAIDGAVRWWKSDANPHKNRRPIEGDIAARVKEELLPLSNARWRIRYFDNPPTRLPPEPEREPCSPERAAEITAEFKRVIKRFGGEK